MTFVISYDEVDALARAAAQFGLTYRLLSDPDRTVLGPLGLHNQHVAEQHAAAGVEHEDRYEGTAHPGLFVLNADGRVTERIFETNYRVRPSAEMILDLFDNPDRSS